MTRSARLSSSTCCARKPVAPQRGGISGQATVTGVVLTVGPCAKAWVFPALTGLFPQTWETAGASSLQRPGSRGRASAGHGWSDLLLGSQDPELVL